MFTALTSKIFGGVAVALILGCAVLWWRAAYLQKSLDDCNAASAELRGSITAQNAEIGRWQNSAAEAAARSATAITDARKASESSRATARTILARKPPPGIAVCDAAWALAQERTP